MDPQAYRERLRAVQETIDRHLARRPGEAASHLRSACDALSRAAAVLDAEHDLGVIAYLAALRRNLAELARSIEPAPTGLARFAELVRSGVDPREAGRRVREEAAR